MRVFKFNFNVFSMDTPSCSNAMFSCLYFQAFADLTIQVLDENDNPPVFKENSYEAAIAENSAAGMTVVPVSGKFPTIK